MALSIRITATASELDEKKFFQYIAERSDVVCCVEHSRDSGCQRTHCHLYISGCKVKYDAIGTRLTSIGVAKGNEGRSIKCKDIDQGIITYMSKGHLSPVFLHGMTLDDYEALKLKWIPREAESKMKPEAKKVEKTDYDIYLEVESKLNSYTYKCGCYGCRPMYQKGTLDYNPDYEIPWDPDNTHEHLKQAMRVIIDTRKKYRKLTNSRKMEEYMYMLINHKNINEFSLSRMEKFLYS